MSCFRLKHTASIIFGGICILLSRDLQIARLAESPNPPGESDFHHPTYFGRNQSINIESYADSASQILPSLEASIKPLNWSCSSMYPETHKPSTLVFVHVFKTAGSTMRNFFQQYGQHQCPGASCATLISCTNATISTDANSDDDTWEHCKMKKFLDRQGDVWQNPEKSRDNVNSTFLRDNVDIAGGHFRIGRLDHIVSDSPRHLRHVAFFRDAAAKYVSGVIFMQTTQYRSNHQQPKPTISSILEQIQQEVDNTGNYHKKYADYLLTPSQMQTCFQRTCSVKEMTDIVKENLIRYNVTIGIVERMKESMEVLHHVMEPRRHDPDTIEFYQSYASSKSRNVSPISTSQVMEELKSIRNGTTYTNMLEYVRFEQEITDFALALHERQYALVQEQRSVM